jgi:integrase
MEEVLKQLPNKGYLFPSYRNVSTVSKKLKRILRTIPIVEGSDPKEGNLGDGMWLHGLRHDTSHKMSRKGVPLKVRMELTNHKSIQSMLRYEHPDDQDLREGANVIHYDPGLKTVPKDGPKESKKMRSDSKLWKQEHKEEE